MERPNIHLRKFNPVLVKWKFLDYLSFFLFIPIVISIIYILPNSIKEFLIFHPSRITLLSIFFSNYVHSGFFHFMSNLVSYLLILFLLFNVETDRRFFYRISIFILFLLPFISSFLNIFLINNNLTMQGFSALVSGFLGYFLFSACNYIEKKYKIKKKYELFAFILLINFSIIIFFSLKTDFFMQFLCLVIALILIIYLRRIIWDLGKEFLKFMNSKKMKARYRFYRFFILLLTVIIIIFSLFFIIPSEINMGNNTFTNIVSHYIGYVIGAFIPILLERI